MKYPTGFAPPRRLASKKAQTKLHLRRPRTPPPDDELEVKEKSQFWKWVGLVALLHVVAIALFALIYKTTPAPPPPPPVQFMSLLPEGDVVKGTPGAQAAPKVGQTVIAHKVQHAPPPPPPEPVAVQPPPSPPPPLPAPKPPEPHPVIQPEAPEPEVALTKPVTIPKPIPAKPAPPKPKVKVDLTLVDGPVTDKPIKKHKPHVKKPVVVAKTTDDSTSDAPETAESNGLSKEQIAAKLAEELKEEGVTSAVNTGVDGSQHALTNPFADFYKTVRDQVMSKWEHPNLEDPTAVNPEVTIHVEKDGRVPPEQVSLTRSSGNQTLDDSALAAARSLGYLLQPLPDGCPPDISINFKLTR